MNDIPDLHLREYYSGCVSRVAKISENLLRTVCNCLQYYNIIRRIIEHTMMYRSDLPQKSAIDLQMAQTDDPRPLRIVPRPWRAVFVPRASFSNSNLLPDNLAKEFHFRRRDGKRIPMQSP